jgi:peroxiredoxin Q/BCP
MIDTNFTLPDQNGEVHTMKQYAGSWVLLYFYPKDDTPGCTKEACTLRDAWDDLKREHVVVLGVSADSTTSHAKFADKYHLPFPLLSDEEKVVVKQFGVWKEKSMFGKKYMGISRESFLINPKGKIVKHYEKVKPAEHALQVLQDVKDLKDK